MNEASRRIWLKSIIFIFSYFLSIQISFGIGTKSITLYESPDKTAKQIATLKRGSILIPIYYPKKGGWVKVANPQNGEVGWIQLPDLEGTSSVPGLNQSSIKQKIVEENEVNGKKVYRSFEFFGPKKLSEAEMKDFMNRIQARQERLLRRMDDWSKKLMKDFEHFKWQEPLIENDFFDFPAFEKDLMVPENDLKKPQNKV